MHPFVFSDTKGSILNFIRRTNIAQRCRLKIFYQDETPLSAYLQEMPHYRGFDSFEIPHFCQRTASFAGVAQKSRFVHCSSFEPLRRCPSAAADLAAFLRAGVGVAHQEEASEAHQGGQEKAWEEHQEEAWEEHQEAAWEEGQGAQEEAWEEAWEEGQEAWEEGQEA